MARTKDVTTSHNSTLIAWLLQSASVQKTPKVNTHTHKKKTLDYKDMSSTAPQTYKCQNQNSDQTNRVISIYLIPNPVDKQNNGSPDIRCLIHQKDISWIRCATRYEIETKRHRKWTKTRIHGDTKMLLAPLWANKHPTMKLGTHTLTISTFIFPKPTHPNKTLKNQKIVTNQLHADRTT